MLISQIKDLFIERLANLYDQQEITAIFKLAIQDQNINFNSLSAISKDLEDSIIEILNQLQTGKPLQHILGHTVFYRLKFLVNEHVLIPRPETEELIELILSDHESPVKILDIGTGSGCIPIAIKKNLPEAAVLAIDISADALSIAKKNANLNKVDICFLKDDALNLNSTQYSQFDVIVSNPPYIASIEKEGMHKNVVDFEPHIALFVEDDPLIFYDKISDFGLSNLSKKGKLYFEINQNLAEETKTLLHKKGYQAELIKDLNNNYRFIKAQLRG